MVLMARILYSYASFRKALSNIRNPGWPGDFNSAPISEVHRDQPGPD
jgi:hypothetical protein